MHRRNLRIEKPGIKPRSIAGRGIVFLLTLNPGISHEHAVRKKAPEYQEQDNGHKGQQQVKSHDDSLGSNCTAFSA